jgi:hypothetical protein
MKTASIAERNLRNHLEEVFKLVSKTTTKKGVNFMTKEISKIDNDKAQLILEIG